jgi:O-Antigen ligase
MSQTTVTIMLLTGAAVAALAILRSWPEIRSNWTLGSTFAFALGWLPSLGTAYAAVTGAKTLVWSELGRFELAFTQNDVVANIGKALLIALAGWILLRTVRVDNLVNIAPILIGGLVGVSMISNLFASDALFTNEILILLALLAAAVFSPKGRPVALGFALFGLSAGLISAVVTAVSYATTVAPCERKCGVLGTLYFGVFNNENQLGVVLLCTLPFVWLAFEGRRRLILTLYLIALVASTGSRTSTAVAVALLLAFAVIQPRYEEDGASGKRGPLLGAAVLCAAAASLATPLLNDENHSFTGRGALWHRARDIWSEHRWFGGGYGAWIRARQGTSLDFVGDYSPHNLWLDIAVATGLIGILLFVGALVAIWRLRASGGGYILGTVLLTIFSLGTLEQPLTLLRINSFTFAVFGLLLAVPQRTELPHRLPSGLGDVPRRVSV